MDFLHFVDAVVSNRTLFPLLVAVSVALFASTAIAPRVWARAHASADAARISPLWSPVATLAIFACIPLISVVGPDAAAVAMAIFASAQLVVSCVIVYRHRLWLWLPLPLTVVSLFWSVLVFGVVILMGLWAQIKH